MPDVSTSVLQSVLTPGGPYNEWKHLAVMALETALILCLYQLLVPHIRGLGGVWLGYVYEPDIWQLWTRSQTQG